MSGRNSPRYTTRAYGCPKSKYIITVIFSPILYYYTIDPILLLYYTDTTVPSGNSIESKNSIILKIIGAQLMGWVGQGRVGLGWVGLRPPLWGGLGGVP